MVDGKPQSVTAKLAEADYSIVVQAHEAKRPVIMTGDLCESGSDGAWKAEHPGTSRGHNAEEDTAE